MTKRERIEAAKRSFSYNSPYPPHVKLIWYEYDANCFSWDRSTTFRWSGLMPEPTLTYDLVIGNKYIPTIIDYA